MTSTEFSKSYRETAARILKEARSFFEDQVWHLVVRRSQESVELCLKAILRQAGVEVPRVHDVSSLLRSHADRLPDYPIDRLVSISRRLREEREISFYGDDMTDTPPETLYNKADAEEALRDAEFVLSLVKEK